MLTPDMVSAVSFSSVIAGKTSVYVVVNVTTTARKSAIARRVLFSAMMSRSSLIFFPISPSPYPDDPHSKLGLSHKVFCSGIRFIMPP